MSPYMREAKRFIDAEISRYISKISAPGIQPLLQHALLTKGKRLRPIMLLLSAQSLGAEPNRVAKLAVSFEFLHAATLVHDDIIDQDLQRRGAETLFSRWSVESATFAGDALVAMAAKFASNYGAEIIQELSHVGLELCEGEYLDANLSLRKATLQDYFAKISMKSASLFRGAARCGAIASGANRDHVEALSTYGEGFGMAYQINDDLEDIGKPQASQDLKNGNVTLPLLYLFQWGSAGIRDLLEATFGKRHPSDAEAKRMSTELEKILAFEHCREKITDYVSECRTSLEHVDASVFKEYLIDFIGYFNGRYSEP